ncbi:MAG: hypothetical protein LBB88_09645 [Planctomycetaceae bacterium]|nr:hypothetical protein [Planctomycetaceae bacterium]
MGGQRGHWRLWGQRGHSCLKSEVKDSWEIKLKKIFLFKSCCLQLSRLSPICSRSR